MSRTRIEWATHSWNVVTGCSPVSEGCAHCYAEAMTRRFWEQWGCEPPPDHFGVALHRERLLRPLTWKKPRRVFVNSMSDTFHPDVPHDFTLDIFEAMADASQHTYIVLTKRPQRMREFLRHCEDWDPTEWPNVWLGVSAENQRRLDERLPILLGIDAIVRFVSLEPLLGPIDFVRAGGTDWWESGNLNWVIIGAESGPKRRECKLEWIRDIVEQCEAAAVPCFVKQLSINGKVSHNPDEWPPNLRVREWPE